MPKYLTAREIRERFQVAFSTQQADALTQVMAALETERVAELAEIRENLGTLVEVTTRLAQAQARTDERLTRVENVVEKLAQAQARTEARVEELAQAQARTDERLTRVENVVEKLAQAQARTEARVEELAQAQARTEARVEELAQAQARTDESIKVLTQAQMQTEVALKNLSVRMDNLAAQVGGLSNRFGFSLEEFSQALLPPWLEHYYGITDLYLERSYLKLPFGEYVEADLAGEGKRDGEPLLVLVECRSMIGGSETRRLAAKMEHTVAQWQDTPRVSFRAIVAMNVHPTAVPVAQELGIVLIPYSKLNRERF